MGASSPPRAAISWQRNLWVLWVAEVLTILGFSMCYPFLPFYLEDLGADSVRSQALWAGAMSASSAGFMAITAPFWGMLADRVGRKPMVVRAMLCGALTTGLMGLVVAPWQLLLLFMLDGALSGTVAAAMTLVASNTPREKLGYALGLLQTAIFTGMSLGPLVGGVLADSIGYRPIFAIGFLLLLLAAGLTMALTREEFVRAAPAQETAGSPPVRLAAILLSAGVLATAGAMFVLRATAGAMLPVIPLYIEDLASEGARIATLSGLTFGAAGLGSALASVVIGRMADRRGHRLVLGVCTVAMALCYLPLAMVGSTWQLVAAYALVGIASGGIFPSAQAIVADLTPVERRGVVFGISSAVGSFGGFIGPFGGALLAAYADLRLVFVVNAALLALVAGWVVVALRPGATVAGDVAEVVVA